MNLQERFTELEFEDDDSDPSDFINELSDINDKMAEIKTTYEKDELTMIAHVLSKLPKKPYEAAVTARKTVGYENLTLDDLKEELEDYWERNIMKEEKQGAKDDKANKAFNVQDKGGGYKSKFAKKFKGDCNKCGKQGHKATDC